MVLRWGKVPGADCERKLPCAESVAVRRDETKKVFLRLAVRRSTFSGSVHPPSWKKPTEAYVALCFPPPDKDKVCCVVGESVKS